MENRNRPSQTTALSRSHSTQKLKFKQVPLNDPDFNELNSKYQLYKRGTPNTYSQDLISLKAKNIKNGVTMMELPAIDSIINQLTQNEKEKQINQRNYELYPNLLKQPKTRYKEMLSEKQEIKDFIVWFETQYQAIEKSNEATTKKFENKQTLIAAGFNEMVGQVAKTSKNRAEILKMLWNRENQQAGNIIQILNSQNIKKQKSFLQQISKIHQQYQKQIDLLRKSNKELDQSFNKEKKFNRTLIENLRILRKRIKKLQYLVKKLSESNINTKKENLNLIEENIKLLMNIKEISQEEAVILNYRKLQVYQQKEKLKHQKTKDLIKLAEVKKQEDNLATLQDLDDKKKALYNYFLERLRQNPDERIFIKEEYFTDEEESNVSIEDYFKTIINRASIKMELLNEEEPKMFNKEKGVNTDTIEDVLVSIPYVHLQKGIQVQMDSVHYLKDDSQGLIREGERKLYQIMGQKAEELIEKQSKKRIIQHRISRKNSLTLLELQSLTEMNSKIYSRKGNMLSSFGKRVKINESNSYIHKLDAIDSEVQSISQSDIESQTDLLAINKSRAKDCGLTSINVTSHVVSQRKSINFQNLLQKINENYQDKESQDRRADNLIKLDEDVEQEIKLAQLQDLISKHLIKHQSSKSIQNPEKYLNKILHSLYKSVLLKKNYNFVFQLLEVIKTSYGNTKSVIWKFLNIVTIIKNYSNDNPLLKIISIFLKINEKFKVYNQINKEQLPEMYFKLFFFFTIKGVNEITFNLWKACTSLERIKSLQFMGILEEYFSAKKRNYIQNKIEELVAASQHQYNKKMATKKEEVCQDNDQIVKLNPILIYILEVYLIEKELYHSSYSEMVEFISTDGHIPIDFIIWVIDFLGFNEERQNQMLKYIYAKKSGASNNLTEPTPSHKTVDRTFKSDFFYKFCLRFDMPLLQELSVATYARFKLLPQQIQQKYFRMIGVEQWNQIRSELIQKYKSTFNSEIYSKAFMWIVNKLEYQIKRGASIYGEENYQGQIKRKEEIFSMFYKIIIIEAHKSILENSKREESTL